MIETGGGKTGPFCLNVLSETIAVTARLTHREFEILGLIALGLSNKHIAERLGLTESTAKTHAYNIYRKLGVGNRVAAVHIYRKDLEDHRSFRRRTENQQRRRAEKAEAALFEALAREARLREALALAERQLSANANSGGLPAL